MTEYVVECEAGSWGGLAYEVQRQLYYSVILLVQICCLIDRSSRAERINKQARTVFHVGACLLSEK